MLLLNLKKVFNFHCLFYMKLAVLKVCLCIKQPLHPPRTVRPLRCCGNRRRRPGPKSRIVLKQKLNRLRLRRNTPIIFLKDVTSVAAFSELKMTDALPVGAINTNRQLIPRFTGNLGRLRVSVPFSRQFCIHAGTAKKSRVLGFLDRRKAAKHTPKLRTLNPYYYVYPFTPRRIRAQSSC